MVAKQVYRTLRHDWGLSDLVIVSGGLLVPVFLGGVGICLLDVMYSRRGLDAGPEQHAHWQ
jgi:hypothetical protein